MDKIKILMKKNTWGSFYDTKGFLILFDDTPFDWVLCIRGIREIIQSFSKMVEIFHRDTSFSHPNYKESDSIKKNENWYNNLTYTLCNLLNEFLGKPLFIVGTPETCKLTYNEKVGELITQKCKPEIKNIGNNREQQKYPLEYYSYFIEFLIDKDYLNVNQYIPIIYKKDMGYHLYFYEEQFWNIIDKDLNSSHITRDLMPIELAEMTNNINLLKKIINHQAFDLNCPNHQSMLKWRAPILMRLINSIETDEDFRIAQKYYFYFRDFIRVPDEEYSKNLWIWGNMGGYTTYGITQSFYKAAFNLNKLNLLKWVVSEFEEWIGAALKDYNPYTLEILGYIRYIIKPDNIEKEWGDFIENDVVPLIKEERSWNFDSPRSSNSYYSRNFSGNGGYNRNAIDEAFDGNPENYWNID